MTDLVKKIIEMILALLTTEQAKKVLDGLIDKIEEIVVNSENKIDDAVVLPLCKKAREILSIPDDDDIN